MPRELGTLRRAEVHGKPCNAPGLSDDAVCPVPEALSIRERIRLRALLGERERRDQRERPSSAARPTLAPGTTRPPCATKALSACARGAPAAPGRNTTDCAQASAPAATTASSAYWSAPRAPPEPMPQPRATKHPTTSATCAAHPSGNSRDPTTATNPRAAMPHLLDVMAAGRERGDRPPRS
ncbi:MAG: hypothetical protein A3G27_19520 [Betaproteobacteria bacterium RIFCSPLOWO2_12_FULL_66_14]|nr:MAG: hypothetical protein A3G27_19520 [Betaproteobacteria bacterium RIFCSPLOWO2_12_FULL_66_14]